MSAKLLLLAASIVSESFAFTLSSGSNQTADDRSQWSALMKALNDGQPDPSQELSAPLKHSLRSSAKISKEMLSMEDALAALMSGKMDAVSAFGATPFGKSVTKIVDLIQKEMLPAIVDGHEADQKELNRLGSALNKCDETRRVQIGIVNKTKLKYLKFSKLHQMCRQGEAAKLTEMTECFKKLRGKKVVMDLRCRDFALHDKKFGNQNANKQIVKRGAKESTESYLDRMTATLCGSNGGKGGNGFAAIFKKKKKICEAATKDHTVWTNKCNKIKKQYYNKKSECNNIQDQMDGASCKRATGMKDACEQYAECFTEKKKAYDTAHKVVKVNEKDRWAEWRGLKRMNCIMNAFRDGKITNFEIKDCQRKTYDVKHLHIKYPVLVKLMLCSVPEAYPNTPAYKLAEFAPLPTLAKGKANANECTGLLEIPTKPKDGSPKTCKCDRLTLNGPYSPGPMVKCSGCLDVKSTVDKNSCPYGTKIFSPRSRSDWKTFLGSAKPLRDPHWIIDVTRPKPGCGGCAANEMNSGNAQQKTWRTVDGSPWWLRSTRYSEPNGDYHANCYLDLWKTPKDENSITFNDGNCNYHSKSYYCQIAQISTNPKPGSPSGCVCEKVALAGKYSAEVLITCKSCLRVKKATQKNSCPMGTKLFAPASRSDWKTFIASARPIRSPHWIVDVTRPQNGCGGCTKDKMNSKAPKQKTWRTADNAPWWLRSTRYNEPNGDYTANCYLDLWQTPANENVITFNDGRCNYHSDSYYCQAVKKKKAKLVITPGLTKAKKKVAKKKAPSPAPKGKAAAKKKAAKKKL